MIRDLLLHSKDYAITERCELYLSRRSRATCKEVIRPALEKGMIVLCDRFNDSTIAYQAMLADSLKRR
jgi:dTMP kinase